MPAFGSASYLRRGRRRLRRAWPLLISVLTLKPQWVLIEALIVVGLPALYTVFPELARTAEIWPRAVAMTLWVPAALLVATAAYRQSQATSKIITEPLEQIDEDRFNVSVQLLANLLDSPPPPVQDFNFRIYAWDIELGILARSWSLPELETSPEFFDSGEGTVGCAYEWGEFVAVTLAQAPPSLELQTPERTLVDAGGTLVAVPMKNARGRVVAVLYGSLPTTFPAIHTPQARSALNEMSRNCARVWIDLLRLASD